MELVSSISELESLAEGVLVPTMGALHGGHAALIRRAAQHAAGRQPVVVSIFVNPTQFAPGEDFAKYPRTLDADVELCSTSGADFVFAPDVEVMYPPGEVIEPPPLPPVATEPRLEDAHRPTHFRGVCQVVARLFDLVRPSAAVFGEKDYQQLLVIKAMVRQQSPRWGELEIVAHPTVRERDGVAMSSRNRYLSPDNRNRARLIWQAIQAGKQERTPRDAEMVMRAVLENEHDVAVDYAVVRDAATLMPIESFDRPARALIAARIGDVRLIDNMGISDE
jgi:pantoate--beta-alanine ligase